MMIQKSNIQTGIWLIGIGILALTNFWWPGIMFVIGLSALANGSFQGAFWSVGIGVLAWFDFWWPGILFLIGLAIIVGAFLPDRKPELYADEGEVSSFPESSPGIPDPQAYGDFVDEASQPPPSPSPSSRTWIPPRCPACGAPISMSEVLWHDDTHAECSYCHTQLSPN